jgi:hypothetical protein
MYQKLPDRLLILKVFFIPGEPRNCKKLPQAKRTGAAKLKRSKSQPGKATSKRAPNPRKPCSPVYQQKQFECSRPNSKSGSNRESDPSTQRLLRSLNQQVKSTKGLAEKAPEGPHHEKTIIDLDPAEKEGEQLAAVPREGITEDHVTAEGGSFLQPSKTSKPGCIF